MEYWEEDVFTGIANAFGELIGFDPVTTSRRRLIYARICVGVGPEMDMPEEIEIESKLGKWKQNIVYETIPFGCFHCKKVGHWDKKCPGNVVKSQSQTKVWKKVDNSLKASHSNGLDQEKQSQVGRTEEVLVKELGNETKKGDNENAAHQEKEQNGKDSDDGERESQVISQKEEKEKDKIDQNSDNSEKRNNGQKKKGDNQSKDNKKEGDNFNLVSNSFESDKGVD
ncbi:uncharacterized protein LOC131857586 [Cryptomeria japonica]|uniref:uncharacterized protein LOC131857586 n=1 Tax=Cryptomeria japonica TaxID=3369 RepID=UPI0027DA0358|nr:uncharacterized protein LOC131857586 [Cryptomeria japonica]